ncbi:hypothetical protein ACFX14_031739 [Malus domestica]
MYVVLEVSLSLYVLAIRRIPITIETVVSIFRFWSIINVECCMLGLSSTFALFVMKRKETVFGNFIQFMGRTSLIVTFFNHEAAGGKNGVVRSRAVHNMEGHQMVIWLCLNR